MHKLSIVKVERWFHDDKNLDPNDSEAVYCIDVKNNVGTTSSTCFPLKEFKVIMEAFGVSELDHLVGITFKSWRRNDVEAIIDIARQWTETKGRFARKHGIRLPIRLL